MIMRPDEQGYFVNDWYLTYESELTGIVFL